MSCFAGGHLLFKDDPFEGQDTFLFELIKVAAGAGVQVQFGHAICQTFVRDWLGRMADANALPFFVTRSPVEDTSDTLIAPDPFLHPPTDIERVLRASFGAIHQVLARALESTDVHSAMVVFSDSERIDETYVEIAASSIDFVEVCLGGFPRDGSVPTLRIAVSGAGARRYRRNDA